MPNGSAAGLQGFIFGKAASMVSSDAMTMLGVAIGIILITSILRKEFTLLCFDEKFSTTQGWPVLKLDVVLMGMVAIVTVIALQSVGLVLAVAMLIIPAASARYWARNVPSMLVVAALIGCLSGWLGATVSALIPRMPTGPIIVLICGFWFLVSFIFGRYDGIIMSQLVRVRLNRRVAMQHLLRAMWETFEKKQERTISVETIVSERSWNKAFVERQLRRARSRGYVSKRDAASWRLTDQGAGEANRIVRNHRLWEVYLINYADIAPSHVDRDADMIEHVLGSDMVHKLETLLRTSGNLPSPHPLEQEVQT
jgi:manganese/zinc/iron transport system permease protein